VRERAGTESAVADVRGGDAVDSLCTEGGDADGEVTAARNPCGVAARRFATALLVRLCSSTFAEATRWLLAFIRRTTRFSTSAAVNGKWPCTICSPTISSTIPAASLPMVWTRAGVCGRLRTTVSSITIRVPSIVRQEMTRRTLSIFESVHICDDEIFAQRHAIASIYFLESALSRARSTLR
jgi:hypothetical protein